MGVGMARVSETSRDSYKTVELADVLSEITPISATRSGTLTTKEHLANSLGAEGQREVRGQLHRRRRKTLSSKDSNRH